MVEDPSLKRLLDRQTLKLKERALAIASRSNIRKARITLARLALRERGEVARVAAAWRTALWIGLSGLAGSLCWFTAFTLQNAAMVFAVGQVEVIFSIIAATLNFGERITRRELAGMTLITLSVMAVVIFR